MGCWDLWDAPECVFGAYPRQIMFHASCIGEVVSELLSIAVGPSKMWEEKDNKRRFAGLRAQIQRLEERGEGVPAELLDELNAVYGSFYGAARYYHQPEVLKDAT